MRRCAVYILVLFIILSISPVTFAAPFLSYGEKELTDYMTIIDKNGSILLQTGIPINVGDEFIGEDNCLFEIITVEGSLAKARLITKISTNHTILPTQAANTANQPLIAIYHTHTDESYIPTDGKSTLPGKGGIIEVGSTLANNLNQLGYNVEHSKNIHEPHDANAYHRSRRTFMKLLTKKPAAIFDLHRDSAPLAAYKTKINNKNAAKLLLVVGKNNYNRNSTATFAKTIKQAVDSKYKGLIKGIFIAKGNYNQDLSPRAILIEVGTQFNSQNEAEHSMALFSDTVPMFIKLAANKTPEKSSPQIQVNTPQDTPEETNASSYDIIALILSLLTAAAAYLYLSTGNLREVKEKLYKFFHSEFKDIFKSKKKH